MRKTGKEEGRTKVEVCTLLALKSPVETQYSVETRPSIRDPTTSSFSSRSQKLLTLGGIVRFNVWRSEESKFSFFKMEHT